MRFPPIFFLWQLLPSRATALIALATCLVPPAVAESKLIVFGDRSIPPYEFLQDGEPQGAVVDLTWAVAERMGRKPEIVLQSWKQSQAALLNGEGHVLSFMTRTKEREKTFDFSEDTFFVTYSLFVLAENESRISNANLRGLRVGVTESGFPRDYLRENHPDLTPVVIADYDEGIRRVLRREIDAVLAATWPGQHFLSETGISGIGLIAPPIIQRPAAMAVRKGDTELLAEINRALRVLKVAGTYDRIIDKWSSKKVYVVTQSEMVRAKWIVTIAALALMLVGAFAWIYRRQRQTLVAEVEQHRRSATALGETEALFRSLVDAQPGFVFMADAAGNTTFVNEAVETYSGVTAADLLQFGWARLVHPDDAEAAMRAWKDAVASRKAFESEHRMLRRDGTYRWFLARGTPTRQTAGAGVCWVGVCSDIDDLKRTQKALKHAQDELTCELADTKLLQEVSVALIELDPLSDWYEKIIDAARAIMRSDFVSLQKLHPERGPGGELELLKFRGFSPEAATFWQWVRADSESICGIALRTGQRVIAPDVSSCKSMAGSPDQTMYRETSIGSVQTTPLLSRSGKLVGMISTHWRVPHQPSERDLQLFDILARLAADTIERKLVEEDLARHADEVAQQVRLVERANEAKSRFLAAASHDLRQPIAALTLYIDTLRAQLGSRHQTILGSMRDCIANLGELLSNLLDISKLDAKVVTPNISDFAVGPLFDALLPVHLPEAREKNLRLRFVNSRLTAHTDLVLFRRMLGNLIANAVRYTEVGGVLIGCRRRHGKVWVEVWDSGIGIPDDKTEEIFEEFKQLDDGARTHGSGLGLAIVARTAELLGLETRVRSRLGAGSVFAIELPLGENQVPAPAAPSQPGKHKLCVALVEDNPAVRMALTAALESIGHEVIAAESTRGLLDACAERVPAIVLSDFRLPGGETGLDVIATVRQRHGAHLPALIMTGETDPEFMRTIAEHGVAVIHKPVELAVLNSRLVALTEALPPAGVTTARSDVLARTAHALLQANDLEDIVQVVKRAARQVTAADGACFVLNDEGMCHYVDEDAVGPLWKGQRFPLSSCISGWVMERRKPVAIEDVYLDSRIPLEAYRKTFVRSLIAVPIGDLRPTGALTAYWAAKYQATNEDIQALQSLAKMTFEAMERLREAAEDEVTVA